MPESSGATPELPVEQTPAAPNSTPRERMFDRRYLIRLALQMAGVVAAAVAALALLGLGQRLGWWQETVGETQEATPSQEATEYTCPMHPQIRQSVPGRCPICGMPLEPVASGAVTDPTAVTIPMAARRLANIETVPVELATVARTIQTVGSIAIDESRMATIAAYVDGRLERLFADYTGVRVDKGDHLAVLYSPSLYEQQSKYVEFRKKLGEPGGAPLAAVREAWEEMVVNLRQRLVELGMTDDQLAALDETNQPLLRQTIYAPIGGTVIEKLAVEGQYVAAGEPIYRIANLSTVWLMLELYPEDAAWIRFGQRVHAEMQSWPGRQRTGRVAFIDRVVDTATRTVGVRVELLNDDGRLRPGDLASAKIEVPIGSGGEVYDADLAGKWISPMHPQIVRDEPGPCPICGMDLVPASQFGFSEVPVEQEPVLVVPRDAVLLAGPSSVVYVETAPGRFEIRPVSLGTMTEDAVVVLSGVRAGERVATSGNFLIDSQMQLSGKPSLIDPSRAVAGAPTDSNDDATSPPGETLEGSLGEALEDLYAAYFDVQASLAADTAVPETTALALAKAAEQLAAQADLPPELARGLDAIEQAAKHLHHLDLDAARDQFKTISREATALALRYRGTSADEAILHFHCPMVPDGGGDWLQQESEPSNPYFGASMLRCGELRHTLPPPPPPAGRF
jgi:Cu(I)/Ag(I) efflux system membrane fusion protein